MRKKGSITTKLCWECEVHNQNEIIYKGQLATLKEIANELGLSYSQVEELSSGRKKDSKGRYDTNYRLSKINSAGKLNNETEEENPNLIYEDEEDNPSLNGFS